jgi:hypothetical protein
LLYPARQRVIVKINVLLKSCASPDFAAVATNLSFYGTFRGAGCQHPIKKKLFFNKKMSGTADIVTKDARLIERFLYQFRDVFRR